MRKLVLLSVLLASGAAHADYIPRVKSGVNIMKVSVNGGSLTYTENQNQGGPLGAMVIEAQYTPFILNNRLNEAIGRAVNQTDARFAGGKLTGLPEISLTPSFNGSSLINLKGISYQARNSYRGTKLGIITFECFNTLNVKNISITGQINTKDGTIPDSSIGMTADITSSTDCDSNLSWILPVVGNLLLNKLEGKIDSKLVGGLSETMSSLSKSLLFDLNRLIPVDKTVRLPGNQEFAIGSFIQNNLAYLLANSHINIKLGKGADLSPIIGQNEPPSTFLGGDAFSLTVNSPSVSFSAVLSEEVNVNWMFQCSIANPSKKCHDPR